MQFSKTVHFKNWSNEDFTWKFDGVSYTFLAGKTYGDLPEAVALHFARHLSKRELGRQDKIYNEFTIDELAQKALPNISVAELRAKELTLEFEKEKAPAPEKKGEFTLIDIQPTPISTEPAKSAEVLPDSRPTESDIQKQPLPVEENVRDNKPVKPKGRPKKTTDNEYTK